LSATRPDTTRRRVGVTPALPQFGQISCPYAKSSRSRWHGHSASFRFEIPDAAEHLENWLSWQGREAIRGFSSQVLGKLAQSPDHRHRILEQGGYLRHLFKASAETLLTIAVDPKHLGARICITSVLHTWGFRAHPSHGAYDRSGGRASLDGNRWISSRPNYYFLPVEALSH
jgi:hypothetical protein